MALIVVRGLPGAIAYALEAAREEGRREGIRQMRDALLGDLRAEGERAGPGGALAAGDGPRGPLAPRGRSRGAVFSEEMVKARGPSPDDYISAGACRARCPCSDPTEQRCWWCQHSSHSGNFEGFRDNRYCW